MMTSSSRGRGVRVIADICILLTLKTEDITITVLIFLSTILSIASKPSYTSSHKPNHNDLPLTVGGDTQDILFGHGQYITHTTP